MNTAVRDTLKRTVRALLTKGARDKLRSLYYLPADTLQAITGRDELVPPKSKSAGIGTLDFKGGGLRDFEFVRRFGDLKPGDRVLDIGCGYGRMAVPLLDYLSDAGSYEGLDIVPEQIEWCASRISKRRSNFRFQLADVGNRSYNAKGAIHASNYRLPYADESMDCVFAFSVFSHLLPDETQNYLKEISRVLAPGGRSYLTFFVLDEQSRALIEQKRSAYDFAFHFDGYSLVDKKAPDYAIAYDEQVLRRWYSQSAMPVQAIHHGTWSGRANTSVVSQDAVVAVKRYRPAVSIHAT